MLASLIRTSVHAHCIKLATVLRVTPLAQEAALKEHLSKTLVCPKEFFQRLPPPAMSEAEHSQPPAVKESAAPNGGAAKEGEADGIKAS